MSQSAHGSDDAGAHDPLTDAVADLSGAVGDAMGMARVNGTDVVISTIDDEGRPEFTAVSPDVAELATFLISTDASRDIVDVTADSIASIADEVEVDADLDPVNANAGQTTNDYLFPCQWAFPGVGFGAAWASGRGAGRTVAVIDTGVDATHPELLGRVVAGPALLCEPDSMGGGSVDPNGHGTHVAGIVGAAADNSIGISGVAPLVHILAVRVLSADGIGCGSDVATAIGWAVDHGANVINLSLSQVGRNTSIALAVQYAETNGVVVVAAAGNDGPTGPRRYPAAEDDVIAVGSINEGLGLSNFSNHGDYVDIVSPGGWILSTLPGAQYGYMSGTSMATPHVAGLAALMVGANPSITPAQIRSIIAATAIDRGPIGRDNAWGEGIIAPAAAVSSAAAAVPGA